MNQQAEQIIRQYNLEKHPEGGYFKEVYRSAKSIDPNCLPGFSDERNIATSIYFLLHDDEISAFHQLKSDEIWYHHEGDPVRVHMFTPGGEYESHVLDRPLGKHGMPQLVIPAHTIFGAEIMNPDGYCLMGCMVAPGFHFDDFELMERESLLKSYPRHQELIEKLTSK